MKKRKFLMQLMSNRENVNYNDLVVLLNAYGFIQTRGKGSHAIYKNAEISELLNVQNVKGEAKPYQIKQFLAIVEKYNLKMEDEE